MVGTVETYRQIIQDLLTNYAQIPYSHDDLSDETIFDQVDDHYLLLTVGWQGRKRVNLIVLHIDIRDGKVWIQCNNTDQDIVAELIEQGIAREDIVLPQAPESEALMEHSGQHVLAV